MATLSPRTLRGKQSPEVIIYHHHYKPKFKSQAGFVIDSVALYPILFIYHDRIRRDGMVK